MYESQLQENGSHVPSNADETSSGLPAPSHARTARRSLVIDDEGIGFVKRPYANFWRRDTLRQELRSAFSLPKRAKNYFTKEKQYRLRRATIQYTYLPLNEEAQEIRLLTILPGTFWSEMRVSLQVVSFKDSVDFEALSYVWGSTENPVELLIGHDGFETVKITKNLAQALPYLRYDNKPRTMWIDAICVNQQDLIERSIQVKRMADIFTNASQVVIWLGIEDTDTKLAMECCQIVTSKIIVDWGLTTVAPRSLDTHWADMNEEMPWSDEESVAICRMLNNDWFTRLWIWQEVKLAPSAIVMAGPHCVDWHSIQNTVFLLGQKRSPDIIGQVLEKSHRDLLLSICYPSSNVVSIEQLFHDTSHTRYSDARDRLFAIFSLLGPSEKCLAIEPNYTETVEQIYSKFVRHYVRTQKSWDILTLIEHDENSLWRPSWVPNFSSQRMVNDLFELFLASGRSFVSKDWTDHNETNFMSVIGRKVASIETVTSCGYFAQLSDVLALLNTVIRLPAMQSSLKCSPQAIRRLGQVLCGGLHSRLYIPIESKFSSLDKGEECLSKLFAESQDTPEDLFHNEYFDFLGQVHGACQHRSFFICQDRSIGLATKFAKPGDIVAVLLGCKKPLILRPVAHSRYLVIGEAYHSTSMHGEAILGPLPENITFVLKYHEDSGSYFSGYTETNSSEIWAEDPRLSEVPLPLGWRREPWSISEYLTQFVNDETGETTHFDPRMREDELRKRGVVLEEFILE